MEKATKTTVTKDTERSGGEEHEHLETIRTEVNTDRAEQPEKKHVTETVTTTTTVEED